MPPKEQGHCACDWLQNAADDPKCPIEFDSTLNEFHLVVGPDAYMMIYHCPSCGGKAPKSKRSLLFHKLDDGERKRLIELTQDLKTVKDVLGGLGEPDVKQPSGLVVVSPEHDGKPETTQSYPVMIYENLSKIADVRITIYPTQQVAITFQGKSVNS